MSYCHLHFLQTFKKECKQTVLENKVEKLKEFFINIQRLVSDEWVIAVNGLLKSTRTLQNTKIFDTTSFP